MIESRPGRNGVQLKPYLMLGRRAVAEAVELASGLLRFRITVRECALDPPVWALLVCRGRRRWVGVTRNLESALLLGFSRLLLLERPDQLLHPLLERLPLRGLAEVGGEDLPELCRVAVLPLPDSDGGHLWLALNATLDQRLFTSSDAGITWAELTGASGIRFLNSSDPPGTNDLKRMEFFARKFWLVGEPGNVWDSLAL